MKKTIAFALILILTMAFVPTTGLLCSHVNADAKAASESTSEHTILLPYYESVQDQNYTNYQAFSNGNGTASRPYVWKTHAMGIVDEDGNTIGLGIPDPKENSDAYYTGFMNYNLTKGKFYGWFAMDYVTEEICTKIIQTNIFEHQTYNMH